MNVRDGDSPGKLEVATARSRELRPMSPGRFALARMSEGRNAMTTYVMLTKWTEKGMVAVKESPKRLEKALRDMGGEFRSVYMTMGDYDLVAIYDAPDDAVAARFTLILGMLGNVRTTTL